MGTKLKELRNGCFSAAMDDEPMFVLLARDPSAPDHVRHWATQREADIEAGRKPASDMAKVRDARECAREMEQWRRDNDGAWRAGLFASAVDHPNCSDCGQPYAEHRKPVTDAHFLWCPGKAIRTYQP